MNYVHIGCVKFIKLIDDYLQSTTFNVVFLYCNGSMPSLGSFPHTELYLFTCIYNCAIFKYVLKINFVCGFKYFQICSQFDDGFDFNYLKWKEGPTSPSEIKDF